MATHSRILAWRIAMDRGPWWATVHGVAESDTTEWLSTACCRWHSLEADSAAFPGSTVSPSCLPLAVSPWPHSGSLHESGRWYLGLETGVSTESWGTWEGIPEEEVQTEEWSICSRGTAFGKACKLRRGQSTLLGPPWKQKEQRGGCDPCSSVSAPLYGSWTDHS